MPDIEETLVLIGRFGRKMYNAAIFNREKHIEEANQNWGE